MNYDITIKIIVVGNTHVGKSSIVRSYINPHVNTECTTTIGVDFFTKIITVNEKKVRVVIWDTAGQEHYRSLIQSYYRGSNAVLLVFDLTDMRSFNNVPYWINQINKVMVPNKYVIILVGNKADGISSTEPTVEPDKINLLLKEYDNLTYIKTSATSTYNINSVFESCITACINAGYYQDKMIGNIVIAPKIEDTNNCCEI